VKVSELMRADVRSCRPTDTLDRAAQIMWDEDCGCVPVVDRERNVVGMITDRDACMAAYTQGRMLGGVTVQRAMSKDAACCRTGDDVEAALRLMGEKQVRRLPVVDTSRHLAGVLSLSDVVLAMAGSKDAGRRKRYAEEILETMAAITHPRPAHERHEGAMHAAMSAGA
jgi:CBS domain-containing protein